jgi:hypothetical protein
MKHVTFNVRRAIVNYVVLIACTACITFQTGLAVADEGFQSLFDGQTLEGWEGNPKFWSVQDGAITGQTTADNPTKGNTFLVWRGGEVKNFELRLKYRIDGGNSGIQYRSKEVERWVISGYQADIDSTNRFTGILYEEKGRGILAERTKKVEVGADGKPQVVGETVADKEILDTIKADGWNEYRIVAKGNHLQQFVNGKLTVDVTDNDKARRKACGLLALQLHAGPPMKVQFKDIAIKNLPDTIAKAAAASGGMHKKVVFVAGRRSHGYDAHEHNAGCLLLAKYLKAALPNYQVDVHRNGWPVDPADFFQDADAIVMYCDGGGGHMAIPHLEQVDQLSKNGVGIVCIHYAVEVPKGDAGQSFLDWLGGYFEMHWSVNPHWTANFASFPDHPICRGVEPFEINDEWYFHMRFRDGLSGVTPILSAVAPEGTMKRPDGPHSGNPHVRAAVAQGNPQHVAWAAESPDGGRGFGFTGGHYHHNWGDDNFRKVVLNAIVWAARDEVPDGGVGVGRVTDSDLAANQDYERPKRE